VWWGQVPPSAEGQNPVDLTRTDLQHLRGRRSFICIKHHPPRQVAAACTAVLLYAKFLWRV